MWRYLRLYGYFLRFSFSRAMEFRLDFFFRIFMDVNYYAVNILFYKVIFLHTPFLAGWNEHQVLLFVCGYLLIDAVQMTVISNNMWWLPTYINRGELDYYLVRPVSSLFFLSFRDFAANSFVNLLIAIGIFIWAVSHAPLALTLGQTLFFVLYLLMGSVLYYCMRMISIIPVFWVHSGRGLDQMFWAFTKVLEKPDRIFTGWVRVLFTFILPFSLIASYPARLFLEGFDWRVFAHMGGLMLLFSAFMIWFWRRGLSSYSSASS
jgi:ABC-2 type transport system permease protein